MKAIQFDFTIPRYVLGLTLGKLYRPILWSGLSCTSYVDLPEPELPTTKWVRVRTRYGGICGTDMGTIELHTTPYYIPLTSFPYIYGHENVGHITEVGEAVAGWSPGQRVVVEPLLWCAPRGFEDLCPRCAEGRISICERLTEGDIGAGVMTGLGCRDTGGGWSPAFVAHQSQLYALPDEVSDENAVMIEPFAVGLHAALRRFPADDETVLIVGSGTTGLCVLAALRALGSEARILVLARYPFQAEAARRLGASEVIVGRAEADAYAAVAEATGARLFQPPVAKRVALGGADHTFECVGNSGSLDDALRLTRSGGTVTLVGSPGMAKGIDWTAVFAQELQIITSYVYSHAETWRGERWKTYDLALHLVSTGAVDLGWMVTHTFRLDEYDRAFRTVGERGRHGVIKAAFAFEP